MITQSNAHRTFIKTGQFRPVSGIGSDTRDQRQDAVLVAVPIDGNVRSPQPPHEGAVDKVHRTG
jgi:hypothetical protein